MSANITYPVTVDGVKVNDPLEHLIVKHYRNRDGSLNTEAFEVARVWINWFGSYTSQLSMFKNQEQGLVIPMPTEQAIHDAHEGASFRLMSYNRFWQTYAPTILPLIIQETIQLNSATQLDDHKDVVRLFAVRWGYLSYIAGLVTGSIVVQKQFDIELRKLLIKINDHFLEELPNMMKKSEV